jgi:NADH:ubiquinone oxidoreductase subunit 5 (subunit L)/multisubunit Na+/H+ antiporter MnhA subunit
LIHNNNNYQDLRRIGGRIKSLSINIRITIRSKVSLAGLPFFAAFYSKESLLESLSTSVSGLIVVYVLMLRGVILTILYSVRFVFLRSYLGARGENSGYTRLKSSYFTVGSIILFLPRVISGKFLFFILSQYSVLPEVRVASKSLVILLITRSLLYYHINRN